MKTRNAQILVLCSKGTEKKLFSNSFFINLEEWKLMLLKEYDTSKLNKRDFKAVMWEIVKRHV